MKLSHNSKKAAIVVLGSAIGYLIAKKLGKKDNYLYLLMGGFIGTCVSEELLENRVKTLK